MIESKHTPLEEPWPSHMYQLIRAQSFSGHCWDNTILRAIKTNWLPLNDNSYWLYQASLINFVLFDTSPLHQFSKFNNFLWVCWFLCKNLSNFVHHAWNSTTCSIRGLVKKNFKPTLDSRINIGLRLLIFGIFSWGYVLMKEKKSEILLFHVLLGLY